MVFATWPFITMFLAPASGILSDRVNAALLGSIGMALGAAGMMALAFAPPSATHFDFIWRISLAALGFGLFAAPNARQILASAPVHRMAAAGALTLTTRMAGLVIGSTVTAALLNADVAAGVAAPLLAAGLAVATGICTLALIRMKRNN